MQLTDARVTLRLHYPWFAVGCPRRLNVHARPSIQLECSKEAGQFICDSLEAVTFDTGDLFFKSICPSAVGNSGDFIKLSPFLDLATRLCQGVGGSQDECEAD